MAFWHQAHSDACFFQLLIPGLTPVSLIEGQLGFFNCYATLRHLETTISASIVYVFDLVSRLINIPFACFLAVARRTKREKIRRRLSSDSRAFFAYHGAKFASFFFIRHDIANICLGTSLSTPTPRHPSTTFFSSLAISWEMGQRCWSVFQKKGNRKHCE
jgi:hypothetical protein